MAGTEELLVKCTELALVMSELDSELPKLKEYFAECKELHGELCKKISEEEDTVEMRFLECQKKLDKQSKKISDAIKKYEKTYSSIVGNEDVLELLRENTEKQLELQERVNKLNERFTMLEYSLQNPDSLKCVLWKAGNKFPIKVHKEGEKSWSDDYYFEVESIDSEYAYGNTYIGDKIYKSSHRRPLDETPFTIYKSQKGHKSMTSVDGFMNIPDDIDETLPFI